MSDLDLYNAPSQSMGKVGLSSETFSRSIHDNAQLFCAKFCFAINGSSFAIFVIRSFSFVEKITGIVTVCGHVHFYVCILIC